MVCVIACSIIHQEEKRHILRVGSLILHSVGQLMPQQLQSGKYHTEHYMFPVSIHYDGWECGGLCFVSYIAKYLRVHTRIHKLIYITNVLIT